MAKYQVEFSDNVSRRYNDMPYNEVVEAKSKSEAVKKVLDKIKKQYPNNKIKLEGVFKI